MKIKDLFETATAGSTAAGSIASVPGVTGNIQRRPSLFGYIPYDEPKKKKKKKKKKVSESKLQEADMSDFYVDIVADKNSLGIQVRNFPTISVEKNSATIKKEVAEYIENFFKQHSIDMMELDQTFMRKFYEYKFGDWTMTSGQEIDVLKAEVTEIFNSLANLLEVMALEGVRRQNAKNATLVDRVKQVSTPEEMLRVFDNE